MGRHFELSKELWEIQLKVRNWHALLPYEQAELLCQYKALIGKYGDIMNPDLTLQTLDAIQRLTITR